MVGPWDREKKEDISNGSTHTFHFTGSTFSCHGKYSLAGVEYKEVPHGTIQVTGAYVWAAWGSDCRGESLDGTQTKDFDSASVTMNSDGTATAAIMQLPHAG